MRVCGKDTVKHNPCATSKVRHEDQAAIEASYLVLAAIAPSANNGDRR